MGNQDGNHLLTRNVSQMPKKLQKRKQIWRIKNTLEQQ